jgi:PAS domain S-box-containing protein
VKRPDARYTATVLALAVAYFAAARFGLSLAFATRQVTAVWPPTGIALVGVLLFGYRVWPAIFLGAFVANAVSDEPVAVAAGIAAGNTLAGLAGAFLLRRIFRFDVALSRTADVLTLALTAAVSTVVSATWGTLALGLGGLVPWTQYRSVWWTWWIGDTLGILIVAPLLLTWRVKPRVQWRGHRLGELMVLFAAVVAVSALSATIADAASPYQLEYAAFPCLIWAALRFGLRETVSAATLISGVSVWGAVHNRGPFASGTLDERLILVDTFVAIVAVTALLVGAVTAEQKESQERLHRAHDELDLRVQERTREVAQQSEAVQKERARLAEAQRIAQLGSWELDVATGASVWSDELYRVFGLSKVSFTPSFDLFLLRVHVDDRAQIRDVLATALADKRPFSCEYRTVRTDGETRVIQAHGQVSVDEAGQPVRVIGTAQDITTRKALERQIEARSREITAALRDKEVLLKEIHHRVKNNLQVISSLLNLQATHLTDPAARAMFAESQDRVHSIALVHEKLYQSSDLAHLDLGEYVVALIKSLLHSTDAEMRGISARVHVEPLTLNVDKAIPCGLIINELVTNSLKHAFPRPRSGTITISVRQYEPGRLEMAIEDDGVGFPPGVVPGGTDSLGLSLVLTFAHQLEADVDVQGTPHAAFRFRFPQDSVEQLGTFGVSKTSV